MSDEPLSQDAPPTWRDSPFAQQCAAEMGSLQSAILGMGGVSSYLEIGCSFGWSLCQVGAVLKRGAKIRGIDFGYLDEGRNDGDHKGFDTKPFIAPKLASLRDAGFDVEIFNGDSHSVEAIRWARDNGPYHLVGIDGDHSYEGVRADWENYGHLGRFVWFHDIANKNLGVMKLWQEVSEKYCGYEFVFPMGIGLVDRLKVIK